MLENRVGILQRHLLGIKKKHNKEKVENWRSALTTAGNISGWHQTLETRSEHELVEGIVGAVLKKLNENSSADTKSLVGMDFHIKQMESLLCVGKDDASVRTVGIWGMGTIGKTTLAEIIFHRISSQFEGCCFLENVREKWKKYDRPHLRGILRSAILRDDHLNNAGSITWLNTFRRGRLSRSKVFIVLDDVDNVEQLKSLVVDSSCFGRQSRIIVTARDKQVLQGTVDKLYEIKGLSVSDALRLFSWHVFKRNYPTEDFGEFSNRVVKYANGNPLALKVIGAVLLFKSKEIWASALNKFEKSSPDEIQEKLRISYDVLDKEDKRIFLDIAFFFKGDSIDYVTRILDGCGFHAQFGLSNLVDKPLIFIQDSMIQMHDLLQQMGRAIVFDESEQPGKRSRLWIAKEASDVLRKHKGTEVVEGIILNLSDLNDDVYFPAKTFEKMKNLRVLKIYYSNSWNVCKVHLSEGLDYLPDELRCLWWWTYPLKSLPPNFDSNNLVDLNLSCSHIEELWSEGQHLPNLRFLDLRGCKCLLKTPDFSAAPNLLRIHLERCTGLLDVHPSIGALDKLIELYMKECREARSFPERIYLESLEILDLTGCSNLKKFPEILEQMECLKELGLGGTAIEELPSSIENLSGLVLLNLDYCKSLKRLPNNIGQLESLERLYLEDCSELESLPSSICHLNSLWNLRLSNCSKLESLPSSIFQLTLEELELFNCTKLKSFPEISKRNEKLRHIWLDRIPIKELPPSIDNLTRLSRLKLDNCQRLQSLLQLPPSIETVVVRNCIQLEIVTFPPSIWNVDVLNCAQLKIVTMPSELSVDLSVLSYSRRGFKFVNCLELDQDQRINIQEEALRLIKHIATPSLEFLFLLPQKGTLDGRPVFFHLLNVLLPESEFLECFCNQSMGSCVNVQLPLEWLECRFMEFSVCVLFERGGVVNRRSTVITLKCECTFKTEVGNISSSLIFKEHCHVVEDTLLMSDHLFLGYGALVMDEWPNNSYPTEASFQFSSESDWRVKKCGVCLVCPQDNDDAPTDSGQSSYQGMFDCGGFEQHDSAVKLFGSRLQLNKNYSVPSSSNKPNAQLEDSTMHTNFSEAHDFVDLQLAVGLDMNSLPLEMNELRSPTCASFDLNSDLMMVEDGASELERWRAGPSQLEESMWSNPDPCLSLSLGLKRKEPEGGW